MLSQSLLEFSIEILAYFGLRSRFLIDPKADLIGELFIIEASGKKGFLNQIKLNFLSPLVWLEVTVNLVI